MLRISYGSVTIDLSCLD